MALKGCPSCSDIAIRFARMALRKPLFIPIAVLCMALFAWTGARAQRFMIKLGGQVTELTSGDPIKGVLVRVVKAGVDDAQMLTKGDGAYRFELERGWKYVVWFSKEGMVSKHVVIDTRLVPAYPDVPFYDMDLQMTLFPWIADFDFSAFDKPLGEAGYKASVHNMSWDTPYTEQFRPILSKIMDEYGKTGNGYYERKDRHREASER
jgi:hypothetical protein